MQFYTIYPPPFPSIYIPFNTVKQERNPFPPYFYIIFPPLFTYALEKRTKGVQRRVKKSSSLAIFHNLGKVLREKVKFGTLYVSLMKRHAHPYIYMQPGAMLTYSQAQQTLHFPYI